VETWLIAFMASALNNSSPMPQGPLYPLQTRLAEVQAQVWSMWRTENLILPAANQTPLPRSSIPQAIGYNDSRKISGNYTGGTNTFTV
jgi:hypothetical protein